MPGSIRSMQVEHVFRDVQTDRGSLLHGRLLRWQFDTVTLAHRCRRGASTPSPKAELSLRQGISLQTSHPAEDVPTTVPHSGRESSRRAAPLCETALSFARPDNDDAPWDPYARRRAAVRA